MGIKGNGASSRRQMEQNRAAVYHRDWQRCVAAERGDCAGGLTLQHRVGRGMGGSSRVGDGPQWYVTMCAHHNARLEADAAFASVGRQAGWSLPRLGVPGRAEAMVLLHPVMYGDGTWWFLKPDGTREVCFDPQSAIVRAGMAL